MPRTSTKRDGLGHFLFQPQFSLSLALAHALSLSWNKGIKDSFHFPLKD